MRMIKFEESRTTNFRYRRLSSDDHPDACTYSLSTRPQKVEIASRYQVLIKGARFVKVILNHNVGRGMAPVDPTDYVKLEALDIDIKQKIIILI